MAYGIVLKDSLISLMKETTEGTYVAPTGATSFSQPNTDKISLVPSKEWHESGRITGSLGQAKPRGGIKKVAGKYGYELRGSGTVGIAPQWDILIQSLLGTAPNIMAAAAVITAGATTTVLPMSSGDVSKFAVGMPVMVQKANNWFFTTVASVQAGTSITVSPALPYSPVATTPVAQAILYAPANSGHPSFSTTIYWANKITQMASGQKVKSFQLSNFKAGQIPIMEFDAEGINYQTDVAGAAGYTPSYDQALSPVVLNAIIYQAGTAIVVDEFQIKVDNTLSPLPSTADPNGIVSQRVSKRIVSGAFAPYKDDTLVTNFTNFNTEAMFSVFITATNPDPANTGQFLPGNNFCIYLPNVITKTLEVKNLSGILQDAIGFEAVGGVDGTIPEVYFGFV